MRRAHVARPTQRAHPVSRPLAFERRTAAHGRKARADRSLRAQLLTSTSDMSDAKMPRCSKGGSETMRPCRARFGPEPATRCNGTDLSLSVRDPRPSEIGQFKPSAQNERTASSGERPSDPECPGVSPSGLKRPAERGATSPSQARTRFHSAVAWSAFAGAIVRQPWRR